MKISRRKALLVAGATLLSIPLIAGTASAANIAQKDGTSIVIRSCSTPGSPTNYLTTTKIAKTGHTTGTVKSVSVTAAGKTANQQTRFMVEHASGNRTGSFYGPASGKSLPLGNGSKVFDLAKGPSLNLSFEDTTTKCTINLGPEDTKNMVTKAKAKPATKVAQPKAKSLPGTCLSGDTKYAVKVNYTMGANGGVVETVSVSDKSKVTAKQKSVAANVRTVVADNGGKHTAFDNMGKVTKTKPAKFAPNADFGKTSPYVMVSVQTTEGVYCETTIKLT